MATAVLKQLSHSLNKNRTAVSQNHFPCLTVSLDGRPRTFLCPLRGVEAQGDGRVHLTFAAWGFPYSPAAASGTPCEACLYLPKTREQYRLQGQLAASAPGPSAAYRDLLADPAASRQFALLFPQAVAALPAGASRIDTRSAAEGAAAIALDPSGSAFTTLTLDLRHLDYLLLKSPQQRASWRRCDAAPGGGFAWQQQELNPLRGSASVISTSACLSGSQLWAGAERAGGRADRAAAAECG